MHKTDQISCPLIVFDISQPSVILFSNIWVRIWVRQEVNCNHNVSRDLHFILRCSEGTCSWCAIPLFDLTNKTFVIMLPHKTLTLTPTPSRNKSLPCIIQLCCWINRSPPRVPSTYKHLRKNKTALCPFCLQFIFTGGVKRRSPTCRHSPCRHVKSFLKRPPREFKKFPVSADIVYVAISRTFSRWIGQTQQLQEMHIKNTSRDHHKACLITY
jgi:hypothetical protein